MKTITTQELKSKISQDVGVHFWNVTTDQYFKGEMIPGSRRVPVDSLPEAIKKASLSKDSAIIVYCAGPQCPASKMAAEKLNSLGYSNVTKFEGGVEEWKKAGYSVSSEGACTMTEMTEKKTACGSC